MEQEASVKEQEASVREQEASAKEGLENTAME
jgi:hypothetical protein